MTDCGVSGTIFFFGDVMTVSVATLGGVRGETSMVSVLPLSNCSTLSAPSVMGEGRLFCCVVFRVRCFHTSFHTF